MNARDNGSVVADAPAVASARAYLRSGLPPIYADGDFGMRFVGGLETLLDPIVAMLDSLPAYFDPNLAPPSLVELMAAWLAIELDESWPVERRRELVRRFADLSRRRGTRDGMAELLAIAFPDLPLRIEDEGGVAVTREDGEFDDPPPGGFVVYCDRQLAPPEVAAVARVIERVKPAHVPYRLRVRQARGGGQQQKAGDP